MGIRTWWARETYVALHAQSVRFRIVKYLVLLAIAAGTYAWGGGRAVITLFAVLFVVALCVHFLFRWKTKAWTQSWGPYKKIRLPEEGMR